MTQNNWIKVEDRLPEHCERVIIFADGNVDTGYYDIYGDWRWDVLTPINGTVTHWMELPTPPDND